MSENHYALQRLAGLVEEILDSNVEDLKIRLKHRREVLAALESIDARLGAMERATPEVETKLINLDIPAWDTIKDVLKWLPAAGAITYEVLKAWFHTH